MIDPKCGTCRYFWFSKGDCTGAATTCEDYNNNMKAKPIIKTRLGRMTVHRRDAKAISVVKVKHKVQHHGETLDAGQITSIDHRKMPRKPKNPEAMDTGWYTWIATFSLTGKELMRRKGFKRSS